MNPQASLNIFRKKEDEGPESNQFQFTELRIFCQRLFLTATLILFIILLIHSWVEIIVICFSYRLLSASENCLFRGSLCLMKGFSIPVALQTQMLVFALGNNICAYICLHVMFVNLDHYETLVDAIAAACLVSLFVFLFIGSMKLTAFGLKIFRVCDIENGALSLLAMMSLIIRFIFVTPIWICYLANTTLNQFPHQLTSLCHIYILAKIAGLWILSVDFHTSCKCFFKAVLLRAPPGIECQMCKNQTQAELSTQCGHFLCKKCIERGRRVNASCPICNALVPRKWTMPFRYGTLSSLVMCCFL